MQVFKTYFKIVKKQLVAILIYFGIFGVIISFMSTMNDGDKNYKSSKLPIVIFNNDSSPKSEYLEKYLSEQHEVRELENNDEILQDYLYYQVIDYILYIDEGYKLTNVKRPGSNSGVYIDNTIQDFSRVYDSYVLAGYGDAEAYEKTKEAMDTSDLISMRDNKSGRTRVFYFYLNSAYIIVALLTTAIPPVVIAMNKKGVRERTIVSAFSYKKRNAQIIFATVITSIVTWILINICSGIICGSEVLQGNNVYFILNSLCLLLISVGIVCIISNFSIKQDAINMISNVVSLSLCFLGGVFVPMEVFGDTMMKIAKCMPTYWYVKACYNISDGITDNQTYAYMGIQLLFAIALMSVALVISKRTKQKRTS